MVTYRIREYIANCVSYKELIPKYINSYSSTTIRKQPDLKITIVLYEKFKKKMWTVNCMLFLYSRVFKIPVYTE